MKRFNEWLAELVTNGVGTMYCAYIFAVIGIMGIVGALTGNTQLVLIIGSISGYFLQLVLLPIIIVGQNIQSEKHDQHAAKLDLLVAASKGESKSENKQNDDRPKNIPEG